MAAWGVVALALVVAVAFSTRFGSDPSLSDSPLLDQPAPNVTLELLDGSGSFDLADLEGGVTVVNFFASWCLECRVEHPALIATAGAFADEGVTFVQVAYEDAPDDTARFLEELGSSPTTRYATDPGSRAAIGFGIRGVPETFFIDAEGVVRGKIQGASDAVLLGSTIDAILAGETTGAHVAGEVQGRPD